MSPCKEVHLPGGGVAFFVRYANPPRAEMPLVRQPKHENSYGHQLDENDWLHAVTIRKPQLEQFVTDELAKLN